MEGNTLSLLLVLVGLVPVDDELDGPFPLLVGSPRLLVDVTPRCEASQPTAEFDDDDDDDKAGPEFAVGSVSDECGSLRYT